MRKIEKKYNKAVNEYISVFEKNNEVFFDSWVADEVGGVASFGYYFFNFEQIKYCVDKNIKFEILLEWQDFAMENYINLDSYCRFRRDFVYKYGFGFDLEKFHKYFLK